jgi:cytochrome b561
MADNKPTDEELQWKNIVPRDRVEWLLIGLVLGQLVMGKRMISAVGIEPPTDTWLQAHTLVGLAIWVLAIVALIQHLLRRQRPASVDLSARRRFWYRAWYALFFLLLLLAPVAGFLQMQYGSKLLSIFGSRLPTWVQPDESMASLFTAVHKTLAYALAGLIFLQLADVLHQVISRGRRAPTAAVYEESALAAGAAPGKLPRARDIQGIQTTFRYFGWLAFWLQLWVAIITAVLLFFVISGGYLGPAALSGNEPGIFWAQLALGLLVLTILLTFYCRRLATKEPNRAAQTLEKLSAAWRHINLMGEYDFSDEKLRDSVGIKPPKLMT